MLLANISVAAKIQEAFPATAVLRYVSLLQVDIAENLDVTLLHQRPTLRLYRIY